ncbi:MAG: hypothetical protein PVJ05_12455 [Candidatus Thorarchaeota archaeon]
MSLGKTEALVILLGLTVGAFGIILLLPSDPVVYVNDNEPEPGSFTFTSSLDGVDDYNIHSIRILDNPVSMHVVLRCGGNDFDVYIALEYTPTEDDYDVRGYAAGGEDFTYDYPEEGIWHFMVHSYSGSGQYELRIDVEY